MTGGTHCTIHVRKKAVLITGNDAITSDNNKNEASTGPPEHITQLG